MSDPQSVDGLNHSQVRVKRILVHICCGPCSIMPLKEILGKSAEVVGYFHNPNIHPLSEFRKRIEAVKTLAAHLSLEVICDEEYSPTGFIRNMREHSATPEGIPPHGKRCEYCYSSRLEATAKAAKENGFDSFTSSLLYSRYQDHDKIRALGVELAGIYGIIFVYEDFRTLWQQGIGESKALGLYRQKYCGCAYSRIERYAGKRAKTSKE